MSEQQPRKRTLKTFTYKGVELPQLLDMNIEQVMELFRARIRRKFARGLKRNYHTLLRKLRKSKKACPYGEKPVPVKTHMRNQMIIPEMIGSVVGVYNGKQYINVEVKPEMLGHYMAEFSITYKPIRHGRGGGGGGKQFVPLR
eukprot:NODE_20112_length_812_cov_8.046715.p2 GENE.NODE_20112_length_812_cov_8.046715~~NODE_20112_length_812_cov_8.046715.p2  ORF type:complete len:143 (+),score=40.03 NODE_20112_length_812_cov_8.046715:102-530(+)